MDLKLCCDEIVQQDSIKHLYQATFSLLRRYFPAVHAYWFSPVGDWQVKACAELTSDSCKLSKVSEPEATLLCHRTSSGEAAFNELRAWLQPLASQFSYERSMVTACHNQQDYLVLALPQAVEAHLMLVLKLSEPVLLNDAMQSTAHVCLLQISRQQQKLEFSHHSHQQLSLKHNLESEVIEHIYQNHYLLSFTQKLHKSIMDLSQIKHLDSLYRGVVETSQSQFELDRVALYLYQDSSKKVMPSYGGNVQGQVEPLPDDGLSLADYPWVEKLLQQGQVFDLTETVPLQSPDGKQVMGWRLTLLLMDKDTCIGWLQIDNSIRHNPLLKHQKRVLGVFSSSVAQLLNAMQQEQDFNVLYEINQALAKQSSLDNVCKKSIELGRAFLHLDRAALLLVDPTQCYVVGTWGTNQQGQVVAEHGFKEAIESVPSYHRGMVEHDYFEVNHGCTLHYNQDPVGNGSHGVFSLWDEQKILGFLVVDNLFSQAPFTAHQVDVIKVFCQNIAQIMATRRAEFALKQLNEELELRVQRRTQALEQKQQDLALLNKELAKVSATDALTQIANRYHFDKVYRKELSRAIRQHRSVAIIMIDIDYFKQFNDIYGHIRGDECLYQVAQCLNDCAQRGSDLVARYGGEEFIILLSDCRLQNILELTHKIKREIAKLGICHEYEQANSQLTISAGFVLRQPHLKTMADDLIDMADQALYQAKRRGRNIIVNYDDGVANKNPALLPD
ncbi:sensor domain-containing diguanylate cyclase [Motilimonas pumila]|uniref:diguanylate cyclase n=1 Tax=Motilimonas pumila TaxID=2303987 RepID=A0A418YAW8_9GAMM|nr:sensor domain-containing diguanylate cyclase [Motilimonas pumila]RJG40117.1 sensor domain-containing diguanylate cyclase [Motilimonas pumila]